MDECVSGVSARNQVDVHESEITPSQYSNQCSLSRKAEIFHFPRTLYIIVTAQGVFVPPVLIIAR